MNTTNAQQLTIRPYPFPDEGARGYVQRLATVNGLRSVENMTSTQTFLPFNVLSGLLGRNDSEFWKRHPENNFWHRHKTKRNVIWNWTNRKYCPVCLQEEKYWRVEWELRSLTTCARHHTKLIDACPNCQRDISWRTQDLTRCACGFDLLSATPERSEVHEVMLAQAYVATLGLADPPERMSHIKHLSTYELHLLTQYLGNLNREGRSGNRISERRLSAIEPIFSQAARYIFDWPESYKQHLSNVHLTESQNLKSKSLAQVFGDTYRKMYSGLRSDSFRHVRETFGQYLQDNWEWSLGYRNSNILKDTRMEDRWISAAQAGKQLQIRSSQITQKVLQGEMNGRAFKTAFGRMRVVVSTEEIKRIKGTRGDVVSLSEASDILGIAENRVLELIDGGAIKALARPCIDNVNQWHLSRSELNGLLEHTQNLTDRNDLRSDKGLLVVRLLRSGLRGEGSFAELINAILAGRVMVTAKSTTHIGISAWILEKDSYYEWRDSKLSNGEICYSIQKIASMLKIKEEVAYKLVRTRLLVSQPEIRNGRRIQLITQKEFEKFRSKFVFNSELAEKAKTSPRSLLTKFANVGVNPYLEVGEHGLRQAIFEKNENFEKCWAQLCR